MTAVWAFKMSCRQWSVRSFSRGYEARRKRSCCPSTRKRRRGACVQRRRRGRKSHKKIRVLLRLATWNPGYRCKKTRAVASAKRQQTNSICGWGLRLCIVLSNTYVESNLLLSSTIVIHRQAQQAHIRTPTLDLTS